MNRLLISGLALAVLTGTALAQAATPQPAPGAPAMTQAAPPPPGGPGGPGDMDVPPPPHGGPMGPGGRRGPPPPPPAKAAHFHLEHGDTTIDVKCADDEPMKACADLTLEMIDKLQGLTHN